MWVLPSYWCMGKSTSSVAARAGTGSACALADLAMPYGGQQNACMISSNILILREVAAIVPPAHQAERTLC